MSNHLNDYQETILVRDKVLAASLSAFDHKVIFTHQDEFGRFYCLFPGTPEVKTEIKHFHQGRSHISYSALAAELAEIEFALEADKSQLESRLRDEIAADGY